MIVYFGIHGTGREMYREVRKTSKFQLITQNGVQNHTSRQKLISKSLHKTSKRQKTKNYAKKNFKIKLNAKRQSPSHHYKFINDNKDKTT